MPGGTMIKNPPANAGDRREVCSLGWDNPLEEGMATYSSILAWRIPWTEEHGGLVQGIEKSQTRLSDLADMHPSPSHRPNLRRKLLWDTITYAQNLSWLKMNWEPHGLIHDARPHVGQSPKSQPSCVCPLCLVLLFSPTQTPRSILPLSSDSCPGLLPEDSSSGSPSQLNTATLLSCSCTLP